MRWPVAIGLGLLLVGCDFEEQPSRLASARYGQPDPDGAPPYLIRYPTLLNAKVPALIADQTAVRRFSVENGVSTEVEAVCDIRNGTDAVCWKPDGSAHEVFTRRLRRRFGNPPPGASAPPRSDTRKIRLIIARVVMSDQNDIQLLSVGSTHAAPNVNLINRSPRLEGEPELFYFGGYAQEPLRAKQTSLHFALSEPLLEKPTLERAIGAKVVFGLETYTLRGMEYRPFRRRKPGLSNTDDRWFVTLDRDMTSKRDVMLLVTPLDDAGHRVVLLDENNNPISQETYNKTPRTNHRYRPAECSVLASRIPGTVYISTNFDPAKVKSFQFEGSTRKLLDITGIPLDPARK